MKICMAGEGAQGLTHMQALQQIPAVEVATLAGGIEADAAEFAAEWKIPHYSLDLEECLAQDGVEAVILTTPNQVHADQTELALNMGKHVLVEIPMGLNLEESQRIATLEEKTGLVCMVCHTLRYMPCNREIHRMVQSGELHLHHIVQHTYFFRRENTNRFGKPRTWTDDLLWHQACHAIDFIYWLFGEAEMKAWAQAGPDHEKLGIPMDISIGMRSSSGCLVTSGMSFNNHGPIAGDYRFIGEENTYLMASGTLQDWQGNPVALPAADSCVEQDREFFDAIARGRQPLTSCAACLPTMGLLDRIQKSIDSNS